jgi:hypothetical protein
LVLCDDKLIKTKIVKFSEKRGSWKKIGLKEKSVKKADIFGGKYIIELEHVHKP